MSYSALLRLRALALITGIASCASLLGATLVLAQEAVPDVSVPEGIPGGSVSIIGLLVSAIIYQAKQLVARPTAETLARAHKELDDSKAENNRLRADLDAERTARTRAELRLELFEAQKGGGRP